MFVPFHMGMPRLSIKRQSSGESNAIQIHAGEASTLIQIHACWGGGINPRKITSSAIWEAWHPWNRQRSSRWLLHFSTWNCPQWCILLLIISNLSWVIPTVVTPTVKLVQSLQVSEFPATFRLFSQPSFLPANPTGTFSERIPIKHLRPLSSLSHIKGSCWGAFK